MGKEGQQTRQGVLGQPGGEDHFSSEKNRLSTPEPPECFLQIRFPDATRQQLQKALWCGAGNSAVVTDTPAALSTPRFENPTPRQGVSAREEKKGTQKARASSSLQGAQLSPRNMPALSHEATPQGLAGWRQWGGTSFMPLGVQKVCMCLFRTKPV